MPLFYVQATSPRLMFPVWNLQALPRHNHVEYPFPPPITSPAPLWCLCSRGLYTCRGARLYLTAAHRTQGPAGEAPTSRHGHPGCTLPLLPGCPTCTHHPLCQAPPTAFLGTNTLPECSRPSQQLYLSFPSLNT